ncbi:MBL fold metallo-hydrolase [Deferribacter autotrophicus]|uniref:MBL fold metallo-hydrolase n=1 Tax=Deferribacter autotrophicus TaxID=500465 RepID=A0A5A8F8Z7_9BACT|nr:MBL fold metallo-hydrolase [Deferribacter autotrophicus]KAA0259491.1 MBL fold metallo-hydrolase [Deferribacter autotrophicus]
MKITDLTDRFFLIDHGPTYTCGVNTEDGVILFDTSLDGSNAKKIDKILQKDVKAIFHTHSHADHMGGDFFFVNKYDCQVYIDKRELSFVADTFLEPSLLYGGAAYIEITGKFLSANSVEKVEKLEKGVHFLNKNDITVFDLSGHSPGLTGYLVDEYLFVGDALFSPAIIEKYKILYLFNPFAYYQSLNKIMEIECENVIFCHKGMIDKEELKSLIDVNINHLDKMYNTLYELCDGLTAEEISDRLFEKFDIKLNMDLINLINSTVKGYLYWLEKDEKIKPYYDKGIRWKRV